MAGYKRGHRGSIEDRFLAKIYKDENLDCWFWTATRLKSGYGLMWLETYLELAHRISWIIYHGAIPEGMQVLHKCDIPSCVNPDHLFLGTQLVNAMDCASKGRHCNHIHPERSGMAKLSLSDVVEIRRMIAEGNSNKNIAALFGVAPNTISQIKTGDTWRNVPAADYSLTEGAAKINAHVVKSTVMP
jgi:hypothetical protein